MKHYTRFLNYLLFMTVLLFMPFFAPEAHAEPITVPTAVPVDPDPEYQAAVDAYIRERNAQYAQRDILHFQIAYLITEDAEIEAEEMAPALIQEATGAHIVHTWDDFLSLNDELPVQVVLIHRSFADLVDEAWMQNAYRSRIMIVGLGMDGQTLKEIIGDNCFKVPNRRHPDFEQLQRVSYIMFDYYFVIRDDTDPDLYRAHIDRETLETCDENYEVGDTPIMVAHGAGMSPMDDGYGIEHLIGTIISTSVDYQVTGFKAPPLPLPEEAR